MPLFKTWDVSRTKKKSVVANTLEELITKGKIEKIQNAKINNELGVYNII